MSVQVEDRTSTASKGDGGSKVFEVDAISLTSSVLGLYICEEACMPCTLSSASRSSSAHGVLQTAPAEHNVSAAATVAILTYIPNHDDRGGMDLSPASECPSLSTSHSSSVSVIAPCTPSLAPISISSLEGLECTVENDDQGFEHKILEPLDTTRKCLSFELLPWGEDIPPLSAPRLSPIELPSE